MAKKAKKTKKEAGGRITRNQRKAMQKSFQSDDPEDLDAQLRALGLSTKNIIGDGNCLFRALSDQYYGHDSNHKAIRQEVCQYLRDNEEAYKFFVEDDQPFEHHIRCMSQNATYGGNMELAAFAKMKSVNIKVYQPGMIYVINGKDDEEKEDDESIQTLHIAYHSWEHYSSVRNIDGPYTGPPEIKITKAGEQQQNENLEDEREEEQNLEGLTSKEKAVLDGCPGTNIKKVRRLLIKYKGNPDKVIDALYEPEQEVTKAIYVDEKPAVISQKIIETEKNQSEKVDDIVDTETAKEKTAESENTEQENHDEQEEIGPRKKNNESIPTEPVKDLEKTEKLDGEQEKDAAMYEQKSEKETEKDITATVDIEVEETSVEPKPVPTEEKKPKKLTARERKAQAKKKQKEAKLEKARAKAARKNMYKAEKTEETEKDKSDITTTTKLSTAMKEMYI